MSLDQYAVFGSPIQHSKSPKIHRLFAKQTNQRLEYTAQEVKPENFQAVVTQFFEQGGKGLNCTVPLKELAFQFATQKTARATAAKAVNTLIKQADGSILGDNTDGVGLVRDLKQNHGIQLAGQRILILGAGGATRGILNPLLEEKPDSLIVANRTSEKAWQLAIEFNHSFTGCGFDDLHELPFDLIVNATSASLQNQLPAISEHLLAKNGVCYDLAYGDKPTAFVNWGMTQNARKSLDGLGMLVEQAAEAFFLWRDVRPNTAEVIELLNVERFQN